MNVVVEGEREGQDYSLLKKRKGWSKLNGECSTFYQKCLIRTICRGITTLLTVAIFSLRHISLITFKKDPSNTLSGSGLKTPTWRNTLSRLWNTIWKNLSQNVKKSSRFKAFVSRYHDLNSERPHSTSALSRRTGLHTNMLCNFCLQPISDSDHHRWSICADDDYALCLACIDCGIGCSENSHGMTRRAIKEGDIHG